MKHLLFLIVLAALLVAPVSLGLVSTLAVMGVIVTRYREEGYQ